MTRQLRIFISSTFQDLQTYRQSVLNSILSLGEHGDDMVYWAADERDGVTVSVERVKQSDLLILILAHRYGFVPDGENYSITEIEYLAARAAKIPVLAFFVDESIPWPPNLVEWEKRDKLRDFKTRVEMEVTRKLFDTPENLGTRVTQALVPFIARYQQRSSDRARFSFKTITVQSAPELKTTPNLALQIGYAEDDLPLILQIDRTNEFPGLKNEIKQLLEVDNIKKATQGSIVSVLRETLEKLETESLTKLHIHPVRMKDNSIQEMFIPDQTLTSLFSSTFTTILLHTQGIETPANSTSETNDVWNTESYTQPYERGTQHGADTQPSGDSTTMASFPRFSDAYRESEGNSPLQSVGGSNRYLGVSVTDGKVYSVGRQDEEWQEWRPFLFESLVANFPDAHFVHEISGNQRNNIKDYVEALFGIIEKYSKPGGLEANAIHFVLSRQSIASMILKIIDVVSTLHANGKIHGDLKAANILLTREGPQLIDEFNLSIGAIAPGWTPDWSAPEQILGEPVTCSADIYAFGKMISDLVAGYFVGEVRKFRTPPILQGKNEFDIFFNPSIYIPQDSKFFLSKSAIRNWTALAQSCLRFDPAERPQINELAEKFSDLLHNHPLQGEIMFPIPHRIYATTLLNGHDVSARVISV